MLTLSTASSCPTDIPPRSNTYGYPKKSLTWPRNSSTRTSKVATASVGAVVSRIAETKVVEAIEVAVKGEGDEAAGEAGVKVKSPVRRA